MITESSWKIWKTRNMGDELVVERKYLRLKQNSQWNERNEHKIKRLDEEENC